MYVENEKVFDHLYSVKCSYICVTTKNAEEPVVSSPVNDEEKCEE